MTNLTSSNQQQWFKTYLTLSIPWACDWFCKSLGRTLIPRLQLMITTVQTLAPNEWLLHRIKLRLKQYRFNSSFKWITTILDMLKFWEPWLLKWTKSAQDVTWLKVKQPIISVPWLQTDVQNSWTYFKDSMLQLEMFHIFLKIQHLVDPDKHSLAQLETRRLSSSTRVWHHCIFVSRWDFTERDTHLPVILYNSKSWWLLNS